jgi:zinc transporter ZupT
MRRLRTQARVNLLLQVVAASLLGSALSMMVAALLTFGLPHRWLNRMVSFSAGVLLATALLDLLPKALEGGLAAHSMFSYLLAGLVSFFLLERTALWRHRHDWLEGARAWVPPILSIAAASFIYIAVSDLMPWLRRQRGTFAWNGAFMAAAVTVVPLGIRFLH